MELQQEDFLQEYFKDKSDYKVLDSIFDEEYGWIGQQVGNNYCYFCKITSIELGVGLIAEFVVPEKFETFKQLLDIFLGEK